MTAPDSPNTLPGDGGVGPGTPLPTGDYLYDPDDWEYSYSRADVKEYLEEGPFWDDPRAIVKLDQFRVIEPTFAMRVPTSFDDDSEVEEYEIRFFDSEEAARAALAKATRGAS